MNIHGDSDNFGIYSLETMIKHDSDIKKYLQYTIGSKFIRISEHKFIKDDETSEIYISKKAD